MENSQSQTGAILTPEQTKEIIDKYGIKYPDGKKIAESREIIYPIHQEIAIILNKFSKVRHLFDEKDIDKINEKNKDILELKDDEKEYAREIASELDEYLEEKYFEHPDGKKISEGGELAVAEEIRNQIGHKALYMLGAKDLAGDKYSFSFKIRGSKKWKHIKIFLNGKDLYDVTFTTWHGDKLTSKTVNDVYADNLHKVIEEETGLYTKLAEGGRLKDENFYKEGSNKWGLGYTEIYVIEKEDGSAVVYDSDYDKVKGWHNVEISKFDNLSEAKEFALNYAKKQDRYIYSSGGSMAEGGGVKSKKDLPTIENGTTVEHDGEDYYVINSVKNYNEGHTYKIRNYDTGKTIDVSGDEIKVKKSSGGSMAEGGRLKDENFYKEGSNKWGLGYTEIYVIEKEDGSAVVYDSDYDKVKGWHNVEISKFDNLSEAKEFALNYAKKQDRYIYSSGSSMAEGGIAQPARAGEIKALQERIKIYEDAINGGILQGEVKEEMQTELEKLKKKMYALQPAHEKIKRFRANLFITIPTTDKKKLYQKMSKEGIRARWKTLGDKTKVFAVSKTSLEKIKTLYASIKE